MRKLILGLSRSAGTINPRVSIIQLCKQRESITATPDALVFWWRTREHRACGILHIAKGFYVCFLRFWRFVIQFNRLLTSYEIFPTLSCSMIVELFLEFEKHMKDLRSIADSFSQFYSIVLLKTLKLLFVETKKKYGQRVGDSGRYKMLSINCTIVLPYLRAVVMESCERL